MKRFIILISKIFLIVRNMLFTGDNIKDIKSACLVEYANYLDGKLNAADAIKYYNKAIGLNPKNYYAYASLAAALFKIKQFERALEYCKKADAIRSGKSVNTLLFVIYDIMGEISLANEVLSKIQISYKNNLAAVYDRLGYTYFQVNQYDKAEHYNKEAIKLRPNTPGFYFNMATLYLAQKKYYDARNEVSKVLEITTDKRYAKRATRMIESINKHLKPNSE
jgi:tetratricopeptide (TPR) repeat protein